MPKMLYVWTILAVCGGDSCREQAGDAMAGKQMVENVAEVELGSLAPEILPESWDDCRARTIFTELSRIHPVCHGCLIANSVEPTA